MKFKLLLICVISFAVGFYMLSTPTVEEASAWKTTVHLSCDVRPWGNCFTDCRNYYDCLAAPPAAGCGSERDDLCDCLVGLNPNYNCGNIPNTIASLTAVRP